MDICAVENVTLMHWTSIRLGLIVNTEADTVQNHPCRIYEFRNYINKLHYNINTIQLH